MKFYREYLIKEMYGLPFEVFHTILQIKTSSLTEPPELDGVRLHVRTIRIPKDDSRQANYYEEHILSLSIRALLDPRPGVYAQL